MPRLATLTAALVLALPGAALAQDAGDDQYQDPFAEQTAQQGGTESSQGGGLSESPEVGGGGSGSSGSSGSGTAGETGTQATPAPTEEDAAQAPAADEATGQLPNTGSDPRALVLCGLAFVLIGVGLRLRTIDPDAY